MPLSTETLAVFRSFSKTLNLAVIAVTDTEGKPIVFASKTGELLGYEEDELIGRPFSMLLPESVRGHHDALMAKFKLSANASVSRAMSGAREVQAIQKSGRAVDVSVAISYHANASDQDGVFLALIQDPQYSPAEADVLTSTQEFLSTLLSPGVMRKAAKKARQAIARKIATGGGIFAVVTTVLTQTTPVIPTAKAAWAAWNLDAETSGGITSVQVAEAIDDETRNANLYKVRDNLKQFDREVMAVAYYRLIQDDYGGARIEYRADTGNNQDYIDTYFQDQQLTEDEKIRIGRQECFVKRDIGIVISRTRQPHFHAILCPTVQIKVSDGLQRLVPANVIAVAIDAEYPVLEPTATRLYGFSPSVESPLAD